MAQSVVVNPTHIFFCVFVFDLIILIGAFVLVATYVIEVPTFCWLVTMAAGFIGHLVAGFTGVKPYVPPAPKQNLPQGQTNS